MMKINNTKILAGLSLAVLILASCQRPGAKAEGGPDVQASEAPLTVFAVNTTTATKGEIKDYLALSGDVVASSTVDAYSDIAGKVTRLYVSVGQKVKKGDPIAEIDPNRPGMNFVSGVATAPISGTVINLPVQVGMMISQQIPVARLSLTDDLEVRTYVAERFVSRMKEGLKAELTLDAWPGVSFSAVVSEVSPVLDTTSRTLEVRLAVPGRDTRLKAGMFAKIRIITEAKQNIVKIPASAIVRRFGKNYLFVVKEDAANPGVFVAERRDIEQGILVDNKLEVLSGLAEGEEVIIRGQTLLEDGSRVNVIERMPPLSVKD
jgi:membrane fusion protein, multidrug efflux system